MQPTLPYNEETEFSSNCHDLPDGWRYVNLNTVAKRGSGHTPSKQHPEYWAGGIKWVSLKDSAKLDKVWITKTEEEISAAGLANSSAVIHPAGTVILSRDAGVGKSAILATSMAVSQHFMAWVCSNQLNNLFLYHVLQLKKPEFERVAVGSTIKTIGLGYFAKLCILLPPLPEQIFIVETLDAANTAICAVENLIEVKTRYKRTLAEQLLTEKRRFPEFKGQAWQQYRLGELFTERIEMSRPDLKLLAITGTEGIVDRNSLVKRDTSNTDKAKYLRVAPGDIAYNTMRMWQGVFGLSTMEGIVSPAYTVCTPNERIAGKFAAYLFKLPATIALFHRHSQGLVSDTLNCKFPSFAKIKVTIPSIAEQHKIAEVLGLLDEEIVLLRKELDALKRQKLGLMQQLLIGDVRVKEFAV